MNIYQEELMDHYEHPRNQGGMDKPDLEAKESNASCGDMVQLAVRLQKGSEPTKGRDKTELRQLSSTKGDEVVGLRFGTIEEVRWQGLGCAVSMAAMSKMSEWLKGRGLEEIGRMNEEELLREAIGWEVNPGRRKCLELAVKVVKRLTVQ